MPSMSMHERESIDIKVMAILYGKILPSSSVVLNINIMNLR